MLLEQRADRSLLSGGKTQMDLSCGTCAKRTSRFRIMLPCLLPCLPFLFTVYDGSLNKLNFTRWHQQQWSLKYVLFCELRLTNFEDRVNRFCWHFYDSFYLSKWSDMITTDLCSASDSCMRLTEIFMSNKRKCNTSKSTDPTIDRCDRPFRITFLFEHKRWQIYVLTFCDLTIVFSNTFVSDLSLRKLNAIFTLHTYHWMTSQQSFVTNSTKSSENVKTLYHPPMKSPQILHNKTSCFYTCDIFQLSTLMGRLGSQFCPENDVQNVWLHGSTDLLVSRVTHTTHVADKCLTPWRLRYSQSRICPNLRWRRAVWVVFSVQYSAGCPGCATQPQWRINCPSLKPRQGVENNWWFLVSTLTKLCSSTKKPLSANLKQSKISQNQNVCSFLADGTIFVVAWCAQVGNIFVSSDSQTRTSFRKNLTAFYAQNRKLHCHVQLNEANT